jgi:hypothetical protein
MIEKALKLMHSMIMPCLLALLVAPVALQVGTVTPFRAGERL